MRLGNAFEIEAAAESFSANLYSYVVSSEIHNLCICLLRKGQIYDTVERGSVPWCIGLPTSQGLHSCEQCSLCTLSIGMTF